jgi:hypothetical protein
MTDKFKLNVPNWTYPEDFIRILETGIFILAPWRILEGENLQSVFISMNNVENLKWIPFAIRIDYYCVACWNISDQKVIYFLDEHMHETNEPCENIYDWPRGAVEDFIHHDDL